MKDGEEYLMKMEEIVSSKLAPAHGPYCQGLKCGNMILTSGAIPQRADGSYVYDVQEATTLTLENLLCVIEAAGGKKESIARMDVVLTSLDDFDEFNKAYAAFFGAHKPVRICTQAGKIFEDLPIEAAAIAFLED